MKASEFCVLHSLLASDPMLDGNFSEYPPRAWQVRVAEFDVRWTVLVLSGEVVGHSRTANRTGSFVAMSKVGSEQNSRLPHSGRCSDMTFDFPKST